MRSREDRTVEILLVENYEDCFNIRLVVGGMKFTHGSGTHGYTLAQAQQHAEEIQQLIPNAEIRVKNA